MAHFQQRANDLPDEFVVLLEFVNRIDSAQPPHARAANDAHHHGFSLVVERVSSHYLVENGWPPELLAQQLSEERVAEIARRCLYADAVGGCIGRRVTA